MRPIPPAAAPQFHPFGRMAAAGLLPYQESNLNLVRLTAGCTACCAIGQSSLAPPDCGTSTRKSQRVSEAGVEPAPFRSGFTDRRTQTISASHSYTGVYARCASLRTLAKTRAVTGTLFLAVRREPAERPVMFPPTMSGSSCAQRRNRTPTLCLPLCPPAASGGLSGRHPRFLSASCSHRLAGVPQRRSRKPV